MTDALISASSAAAIDRCTVALAVAFQRHIDIATMKIYRETLSDLPLWAIEAAAMHLRRKGGVFFPTAPTWHQVAEELIASKTRETLQLAAGNHDGHGHECEGCRDTGWGEVERDGRVVCIPCSCRPTNANYRRLTLSSRRSHNEEVKR